jgi:hypothetical protein
MFIVPKQRRVSNKIIAREKKYLLLSALNSTSEERTYIQMMTKISIKHGMIEFFFNGKY